MIVIPAIHQQSLSPFENQNVLEQIQHFQRGIQGDWEHKNPTETRNFLISYSLFLNLKNLNLQSPFGSPFNFKTGGSKMCLAIKGGRARNRLLSW